MVSLAQQALQQCPNSKIVLSGYSQGGFVVHVAAQSLKPAGGKIHYLYLAPSASTEPFQGRIKNALLIMFHHSSCHLRRPREWPGSCQRARR